MPAVAARRAEFDGAALITALDARRAEQSLTWPGLAVALHAQSALLNKRQGGDAMCPGALVRTAHRGTMSCQYALVLLRFVGRPPEDFLTGPSADAGDRRLPEAGPAHRLRFDLAALHAALNARRTESRLTWAQLAGDLGCTPARLTNLRTAHLADMGLVLRVTQWLGAPAARFVRRTEW